MSKAEPPQKLCLDTSPLEWSVTDVVRFIRTTDCAPLARIFLDQVWNTDSWWEPTPFYFYKNTCINCQKCIHSIYLETSSMLIYVFVGDWWTGAAAAEPPNSTRVHGPKAGAGHQALPPHRAGQAGFLSTVCYVADGKGTWDAIPLSSDY